MKNDIPTKVYLKSGAWNSKNLYDKIICEIDTVDNVNYFNIFYISNFYNIIKQNLNEKTIYFQNIVFDEVNENFTFFKNVLHFQNENNTTYSKVYLY